MIEWKYTEQFSNSIGRWPIPPMGDLQIGEDENGDLHIKFSGLTNRDGIESFITQMNIIIDHCQNTLRYKYLDDRT